ncbi:hypothetical protein FRC04_003169 [Tulasnella sp. 424]|nr:hypothetical protein FRC04_003169 [Tulasnella sp. 424]KAG8966278.1 hypothetical protein FRC05_002737 [Tulasnella sp. 425]
MLARRFLHKLSPRKSNTSLYVSEKSPVQPTSPNDDIRRVIDDFLLAIDYRPRRTRPNAALRQFLSAEIQSWNVPVDQKLLTKLTQSAAILAETSYGHLPEPYLHYAALYSCFFFYADDFAEKNPDRIKDFHIRFLRGQPQDDPVLDKYAEHLRNAYDMFPQVAANMIVSGSLEFLTATYIETTTKDLKLSIHATPYPWFLRSRSGVGVVYGHMAFPKSETYDVQSYIQLAPEFEKLISLSNDVLSFYKENLAGETNSFLMNRAAVENKDPLVVLKEIAAESAANIQRIVAIASEQSDEVRKLALNFTYGYVEFHMLTPRYRLEELGIKAE